MHREISQSDRAFQSESRTSLYLLTIILGFLIGWDILPWVSSRIETLTGFAIPSFANEFRGFRIALIAAILGGARVLYGSLDSLLQGKLGADLALAIACVAAILIKEPLVAAEVVFIGLVGECLEGITFDRTQKALRGMLELFPRRCWRLDSSGNEQRILVEDLKVGDTVRVKPGARFPADGVILDGTSEVNTAALTGESIPQLKTPGDNILAGCLNGLGAITFKVMKVGNETAAGRVFDLTVKALASKNKLERTADRLARWFLPVVLCLAMVTFLGFLFGSQTGWFRNPEIPKPGFSTALRNALYPALSILVVACPCALILATPAAMIAAMGRLAGTGILIKGGNSLEQLAQINAFAFDKTGTLTEGKLEIGQTWFSGAGTNPDETLRLVASVEQSSEHPLAKLLVNFAKSKGIALSTCAEFKALPGFGIEAFIGNEKILVGSPRLFKDCGINIPEAADKAIKEFESSGQTVMVACIGDEIQAIFGARDRIRPEAVGVISKLREMGIERISLLSGDRQVVALQVANYLGIEECHGELLPADKEKIVAEIASSYKVAMVGDGINDAPALARSNVGLAVGGPSGIEVVAESGDVVLLGDPLRFLPLLIGLSRATLQTINQNIIYFAFGVNIVGIVITGWLWPLFAPTDWMEQSPLFAVIYHQFGSFAVLLNSMRLLWFQRESSLAASSSLSKLADGAGSLLERILDIDEHIDFVFHNWQKVIAVFSSAIILVWLSLGLIQIQSNEIGLVQRLGRLLDDQLEPGLHWRLPFPFEKVTRIQPAKVRTIEIGFRTLSNGKVSSESGAWTSRHESEGFYRVPDEAVMITGDGNLMEIQGSIRYIVTDPRKFLFNCNDVDAILRANTESILRELVGSKSLGALLTEDRGKFQFQAANLLESRINSLDSSVMGVKLEGLSLHDLHPPQEVVRSYYAVTQAMEMRDRKINDAQGSVLIKLADEFGRALLKERLAQAYRDEIIDKTKAQTDVFYSILFSRNGPSTFDDFILISQSLLDVLKGAKPEEVARITLAQLKDRRESWKTIADFRRFWNAISYALSGRDKIIIDSDKPVKSNLWLLPSDFFRIPGFSSPADRPKSSPRSSDGGL